MTTFQNMVDDALEHIEELFPWDLEEELSNNPELLLLDIREPDEYSAMHIQGAMNVPRGILETSCEFDYEESLPELANARNRDIVVICRSGKRSALAADVMLKLGYNKLRSLKTGMRGWSDYDQEMVDSDGNTVDEDTAIEFFTPRLTAEQMSKK